MRLILETSPRPGPTNMAVDAALLEAVRAGADPTLRLYRWASPTLSFGRNQPAAGLYDRERAERLGIGFVRRPTGGQAVLHDDELTYAVAIPAGELGGARATYRRINAALAAGLASLGVPAQVLGEDVAAAPGADWTAACFRRPSPGEVIAAGGKLVGSAQRCEGRTILQHGSILVGGSQAAAEELLVEARRPAPDEQGTGWVTLGAVLGERPSWAALAGAVVSGFEEVLGIRLAREPLTVEEAAAARRLRERYASGEWTWRR